MVLRSLFIFSFMFFLSSCQSIPDYAQEQFRDSLLKTSSLADLERWLWTCRSTPESDRVHSAVEELSEGVEQFFTYFRERRLSLVDVEPSSIPIGTAFLWNRQGVLIFPLSSLEGLGKIECRSGLAGWTPARLVAQDEIFDLALLQLESFSTAYENFPLWQAESRPPQQLSRVSFLTSLYPGLWDETSVNLSRSRSSLQTGLDDQLVLFQPRPEPARRGGILVTDEGGLVAYVLPNVKGHWGLGLRVEFLRSLVDSLLAGEPPQRAYYGFSVKYESGKGFVVQTVEQSSPARQAGWRPQDIIRRWEGQELRQLMDWPKNLLEWKDASVVVEIERGGNLLETSLRPVVRGAAAD